MVSSAESKADFLLTNKTDMTDNLLSSEAVLLTVVKANSHHLAVTRATHVFVGQRVHQSCSNPLCHRHRDSVAKQRPSVGLQISQNLQASVHGIPVHINCNSMPWCMRKAHLTFCGITILHVRSQVCIYARRSNGIAGTGPSYRHWSILPAGPARTAWIQGHL